MKFSLKEFFLHEAPEVGLDKGGGGMKPDTRCPECGQDFWAGPGHPSEPGYKDTVDCPHCGRHFDADEVESWAQLTWPSPENHHLFKSQNEKSLGSYKHPTTHLAKKFSKQKGVKDPWALAQHVKSQNESAGDQYSGWDKGSNSSAEKDRKADEAAACSSRSLKEYEDPTSSKHSEGDSKWASPFSKKERMPHEHPQSDAQERSADAWKKIRPEDGQVGDRPRRTDKGGKNPGKLKDFFGGEPFPKNEESGYQPGNIDLPDEDDEGPIEIPSGDMDQFAVGHGEEDWEHSAGGIPDPNDPEHTLDPYEMSPQQLKQWAKVGQDDSPIEKSAMYDQDPVLGTKPHEFDWTQTTAFNDDEPRRAHEGADDSVNNGINEGDADVDAFRQAVADYAERAHGVPFDVVDKISDKEFAYCMKLKGCSPENFADLKFSDYQAGRGDWLKGEAAGDVTDDEEEFLKSLEGDDAPPAQAAPAEPEIDWSQLDDEGFIDQLSTMEPDRPERPAKSQRAEPTPSEEFSWDEFRATHPDEAAEAERRFSPDDLSTAKFKKKKSGFMTATMKNGRRLLYMGDGRGWLDMDDEGSPAGEF